MKNYSIIAGIAAILLLLISCDNFRPDHSQAGMGSGDNPPIQEADILRYADSIKINLPQFQKHQSLVYTKGNSSLFVTKYLANGKPVLYIENREDAENQYYVKDGKLLLYVSAKKTSPEAPERINRLYFRNSVLFYAEEKRDDPSADPDSGYSKIEPDKRDYGQDLQTLEDAIRQRNKFNMAFDRITEYPGARYLILSNNSADAYKAIIKIENDDDLIQELSSNPSKYQGRTLNIEWRIDNDDREAIYVSGQLK